MTRFARRVGAHLSRHEDEYAQLIPLAGLALFLFACYLLMLALDP